MSEAQAGIWEYRIEANPDVDTLNELGSVGWELVGIESGTFYLKRPGLNFRDRVTLDQKRHYYEQKGKVVSNAGAGQ